MHVTLLHPVPFIYVHVCTIHVTLIHAHSMHVTYTLHVYTSDMHVTTTIICDCLSENPPGSHLLVFREIPF